MAHFGYRVKSGEWEVVEAINCRSGFCNEVVRCPSMPSDAGDQAVMIS